jgi:tetratricopeptide (TPR) repeat protein
MTSGFFGTPFSLVITAALAAAGLGFAGSATAQQTPPAPAQRPAQQSTQQSRDRTACNDPKSTDDQTIAGCSALIKSGRDSKHNLAVDYNNRGLAFYDKRDYDHAIADYNQALRIDANLAQAYNGRCAAQNAKGNTGMAIADCDQAIQIDPNFAFAYNNRGIAKRARGDSAGGDADIARAIELDPTIAK